MELVEHSSSESEDIPSTIENGVSIIRENGITEVKGSSNLSTFLMKSLKQTQEQIEVEINPLDLLSTIIEEDQKSAFPVLPTKHFLLGRTGLTAPKVTTFSCLFLNKILSIRYP